ncbi:MAG: IS110 family transposase, partial [Rhodobacter sp.]|nr:IS110 family transposase [Rhodobacter sp.]
SALVSALPDIADFQSGRDLSAWLGLTPKPHSTGGKERLGRLSKMGNKYLRRLLYLGAIAQVRARRRGEAGDDWLWKIIRRKKPKTGRDRPGQPHGAHRLCADEEPDGISGRASRLIQTGAQPLPGRQAHRERMAHDGHIAKDTLFGPERPAARAIDRDQSDRGLSSGRAAILLQIRRRIQGRSRNHASITRKTLAPQEPSTQGPSDNGECTGVRVNLRKGWKTAPLPRVRCWGAE